MSLRYMLAVAALSLAALAPVPTRAATFDVIYPEHFDVTLCPAPPLFGCGFTIGAYPGMDTDFMLLVNQGSTEIGFDEFIYTAYTATSSEPSISLLPSLNVANPVTPIVPNEAVGTTGVLGTDVLPSLIQPGETYRNTTPFQVFAFSVWRNFGDYQGPVMFDVTIQVGSEFAQFEMTCNVQPGSNAIQFSSAARVSSQSGPTAVARTSWGKLKSIYR